MPRSALRNGQLKVLVIDGLARAGNRQRHVSGLQISSPHRIADVLQRVDVRAIPCGSAQGTRFRSPATNLVECARGACRRTGVDRVHVPEKPLDVIAQQSVRAADEEWTDSLYDLFCNVADRALERVGVRRDVTCSSRLTPSAGARALLTHDPSTRSCARGSLA